MSHVYAGVLDYCSLHGIPLKHGLLWGRGLELTDRGVVWVEVECDHAVVRLCFDMADWPDIANFAALSRCDYYVKRSFSDLTIGELPAVLRDKVLPYGLYFACSTGRKGWEFRTALSVMLQTAIRTPKALPRAAKEFVKAGLRWVGDFAPVLPLVSSITAAQGGTHRVLYQTRLWDPQSHYSYFIKSVDQINQTRMELVRTLKQSLGDRFVGGIIPSDYSRRQCPDLLTSRDHESERYLALVSQCSIVVTDTGLHGSAGSRLGEYFAAGKCIVSEPIHVKLPIEPSHGSELYIYNSVNECANICRELLDDPAKVAETSRRARAFYDTVMRPDKLFARILDQACETHGMLAKAQSIGNC